MHQGLAGALPLAVRVHSQRPKSQRRLIVDSGATAHHVADYFAVSFGNDRELGDDVTVCPEPVDQKSFRGGALTWPGKRCGVKGEDAVVVSGQFASQKHSYRLPDDRHGSP